MNRAELRRQKREEEKDKKILHITRGQLKQIVAAAIEKEVERLLRVEVEKNFIIMLGMSCLSLHDSFSFGKERLQRFMDDAIRKYDCMIDDYDAKRRDGYDFDLYIKLLKKDTGFDLEKILRDKKVIR